MSMIFLLHLYGKEKADSTLLFDHMLHIFNLTVNGRDAVFCQKFIRLTEMLT